MLFNHWPILFRARCWGWPWARRACYWPALGLAATLLTGGLMAYVGSLGGLVRHTEPQDNPHQRPASRLP